MKLQSNITHKFSKSPRSCIKCERRTSLWWWERTWIYHHHQDFSSAGIEEFLTSSQILEFQMTALSLKIQIFMLNDYMNYEGDGDLSEICLSIQVRLPPSFFTFGHMVSPYIKPRPGFCSREEHTTVSSKRVTTCNQCIS